MGLCRSINLFFVRLCLSKRIRNRADKYFKITLNDFKKKHKRKPNRDEIFLLVVKTSHRTAGVRVANGKRGHVYRQRIRKYLLLKDKIRDNYKIKRPR